MDKVQTLTFAVPERFEGAFQMSHPARPEPAGTSSTTATSTVVDGLHRVDKEALGLAEVASMIALAVIAHRLMTTKERVSSITGREVRSAWIPEDTEENRKAFQARFGKGRS